jgi:acetyl/propionyl-CoA carboxylase alpha subunit
MGVESIVVAPKNAPASRHIEAADRSIEVDFDEAKAIPSEQLAAILEQAGADAAHLGYEGQPEMFELASAAEKADVAVIGTDLDVLGALADSSTIRAAAAKSASWSPRTPTGRRPPSRNAIAVYRLRNTR